MVNIPSMMTIITIDFANCSPVGRLTGNGRLGVMFRRIFRSDSEDPEPRMGASWRRLGGLITAYGLHVTAPSWRDLSTLGSIKHRRVILALTL